VPFEDGPALGQAGRRGGFDVSPEVVQVGGGEFAAEGGEVADADPVGGAREGQDVEGVTAAFVERGVFGDDADRGVRAAGQCEQVRDLAGHGLGAPEPEFEGALVDDHFKEPGHAGGPVCLAVREQVPLLIDVASAEDTRRDLTEVALCLHQGRDQPLLGPGPGFNRAYAMTTDLTQPVIIATLPVTGDEPAPLLIDGTHRLYKAHATGAGQLPAWVLTETETLTIRAPRGSRATLRLGTGGVRR
jgi:hypothetical protein